MVVLGLGLVPVLSFGLVTQVLGLGLSLGFDGSPWLRNSVP